MKALVVAVCIAITLVIALIVGIITWRRFDYFYLSRQKKYRHAPYELLKMKLEKTLINICAVLVFGGIVVCALLNE